MTKVRLASTRVGLESIGGRVRKGELGCFLKEVDSAPQEVLGMRIRRPDELLTLFFPSHRSFATPYAALN